jgi:dihydrofolate reductase
MTNNKTTLRKLKLQVQMSIDGYIAGPDGEMDWLVWNWDDNLKEHLNELTEKMSTMFQEKSLQKRESIACTRKQNMLTLTNVLYLS